MRAAAAQKPGAEPAMLSGIEKSAILIMYLDREVARQLLRKMSDEEVKRIGIAISAVQQVEDVVIEQVVADFVSTLREVNILPFSGRDFANKVLPGLVDEGRREAVSGAIRRRVGSEFEEFVRGRSPVAVATVLAEEHPQVRAIALLRMGPDNAAKVLATFDEEAQFDVTMRMARAERVSGELADEVERTVRRTLEDQDDPLPIGGTQVTARILSRLSKEANASMLTRMRDESADLAETVQRLMVTFDDLDCLDDRAIQALLRSVDRTDLVLALKGATVKMRDRFLKNLSTRASADLVEEIELLGSARRSAIKRAQENVTTTAQRLHQEGTIVLIVAGMDE
jgi:flagellar motor switch protein FliG